MSTSASAYDQALSLFTSLSFTEKLSFLADATIALKKEGKSGSLGKAAKKEKKEKDADAPKRAMPAGTLAWLAFVAHCKTTMPERFEGITQVSKKLTICKEIRGEDEQAYKKFADDFMAKASSPASVKASPAASPSAVKKVVAAEAKPKADTVEEKKKKIAEAKEAAKEAKEAKEAAKATAAAAKEAKPKKEPKKTKAAEAKVAPSMPKKEIDGEEYFTDPDTNGLWKIDEDDRLGAWVGYFQPDNTEEPIRHTDSFADA
jgi:hypothetical protein